MTAAVTITFNNRSYEGVLYETSANKGSWAISLENAGNSKAGSMTLGIKLDENGRDIVTLAKIHKTRGHDFYFRKIQTQPPLMEYVVVRTPENYREDSEPNLGYPGLSRAPLITVNCDSDDTWTPVEHLFENSYSPKPR